MKIYSTYTATAQVAVYANNLKEAKALCKALLPDWKSTHVCSWVDREYSDMPTPCILLTARQTPLCI